MAQVLFFGASITQGVGDSEGGWVDRLKRELHQRMFGAKEGSERDEIFNLGIAGNTSAMLLERLPTEIQAREWHGDPFVFIVSVGTNDSKATPGPGDFVTTPETYGANLQKIADTFRSYSDKILFVGLPPNDDSKTQPLGGRSYFSQKRLGEFDKVMTQIAAKNGLPKVEIFKPMLEQDWQRMLFKDGLHPNAVGHAFIADKVRPELWKLLDLAA